MSASAVTLRPVSRQNWLACTELQVRPEQRALFPVPVVFWLAEAYVEPSFRPLAVYAGERLVGFMVHGVDPEDGEHW